MLTRREFFRFVGRSFLSALTLGAYATAVEAMGRPLIRRYTLTPPRWTSGLRLKIAVLADFHACEPWMNASRIASICDQANELEADIILLLGDYASGMNIFRDILPHADWSYSLSRLKAPLGVHAVLGNHDWWEDLDAQERGGGETFSHRALRDIGIPVYDNDAIRIEKDGHAFWLAGLADQVALKPGARFNRRYFKGLDDLPGMLGRITDEAPVILMAHEPDIFPNVPERISLTLCGHTHGGQVNLFGWTPVVPSRFKSRYAYGHKIEHGRHVIITGGLGCSILPIRFGVWPEIVLLELGES